MSWNGGGFDLPVLHYRALVHGIRASRYWDLGEDDREFKWNNYISRYHSRHTDLMDVLAMYQARANAPLDALASGEEDETVDRLYAQAVAVVCRERKASTSFVQRQLQIGYNRAARIIERMEAEGIVSGANHVGKREVLARGGECEFVKR